MRPSAAAVLFVWLQVAAFATPSIAAADAAPTVATDALIVGGAAFAGSLVVVGVGAVALTSGGDHQALVPLVFLSLPAPGLFAAFAALFVVAPECLGCTIAAPPLALAIGVATELAALTTGVFVFVNALGQGDSSAAVVVGGVAFCVLPALTAAGLTWGLSPATVE